MTDINAKIQKEITDNPIVLFMKGTPTFPQCGFSGKVVYLLQQNGVDFKAINVLEDDNIRQGIKDYANWPTIPQLYVNGEFIGGCDIITQLHEQGELARLVKAS